MCFVTAFTVSKLWMHTCKTTSQAVQKLVRRKNPCAWTAWTDKESEGPLSPPDVRPSFTGEAPLAGMRRQWQWQRG